MYFVTGFNGNIFQIEKSVCADLVSIALTACST